MPRRLSVELRADIDRFWSKVDRDGGPDCCWPWLAGKFRDGYGQFGIARPRKNFSAHRVAYELLVGPIPDGLVIDHLCRNRGCCNPAHMEPVTNAENLMRGMGVGARNAAKTECKNGHPFDDENTIHRPTGGRDCRRCRREIDRRHRARIAGKAPEVTETGARV